jgi:hypothetical protein
MTRCQKSAPERWNGEKFTIPYAFDDDDPIEKTGKLSASSTQSFELHTTDFAKGILNYYNGISLFHFQKYTNEFKGMVSHRLQPYLLFLPPLIQDHHLKHLTKIW